MNFSVFEYKLPYLASVARNRVEVINLSLIYNISKTFN